MRKFVGVYYRGETKCIVLLKERSITDAQATMQKITNGFNYEVVSEWRYNLKDLFPKLMRKSVKG